ncbi:MAG: flavodoxin-dependent (E)-4-hydroxy-3-methylbut-2-enyl-diphosphate synthase [Spirochaetia bacterium]|nr:flavodoxin-dependent (E)-4-hydroxy-3-methylbut-2-enyl-diphosphate synthase [Spirochaetia bacterium]
MERKKTKTVMVGNVPIGSGHPIAVQTMWDKPIQAYSIALLDEIGALHRLGCNIIRFSAQSDADIDILKKLVPDSPVPVVADIHFDFKLALKSIAAGVQKIRINPGNIGADWKVREIIHAASDQNCAIRIGLNGGSLPVQVRNNKNRSETMINLVEDYINLFLSESFENIIISLKDSDHEITYQVNKLFSERFTYPLHLGVTEAGPVIPSIIRSAYTLGRLLQEGIGDTIRVSITGPLKDEIYAGKEILKMMNLYESGVKLVSCPKCGRSGFDTHWFVSEMQDYFQTITNNISIAVMGCAVNGPGEASHADIGITGIGKEVFIFRKGEIVKKTTKQKCKIEFIEELQKVIDEKTNN